MNQVFWIGVYPGLDRCARRASTGRDSPIFRRGTRMRVLVTGATGFVGSCLTELLVRQGHTVAVLRRGSTRPWRIESVLPRITSISERLGASHGSRGGNQAIRPRYRLSRRLVWRGRRFPQRSGADYTQPSEHRRPGVGGGRSGLPNLRGPRFAGGIRSAEPHPPRKRSHRAHEHLRRGQAVCAVGEPPSGPAGGNAICLGPHL